MQQEDNIDDNIDDIIKQLADIEVVAEEILSDKQQIVDLDKKRNKCREAARSLKKLPKSNSPGMKSWVCFGNTFIKMDTSKCMEMLESDQRTLDNEIDQLRDGLKPKVAKLHKMEGMPEIRGFDLKGMKMEDVVYVT